MPDWSGEIRRRLSAVPLPPEREAKAAARLMQAIEKATGDGVHTPDLGGKARTVDVTAAVVDAIHNAVYRFNKKRTREDDQTIVAMEIV